MLALVILLGGCRTTGGKLAAGIGVIGISVEAAGVVEGGRGRDTAGTILLSSGTLIAVSALLTYIGFESPLSTAGSSAATTSGVAERAAAGCDRDDCSGSGRSEPVQETSSDTSCTSDDCRKAGWAGRRSWTAGAR